MELFDTYFVQFGQVLAVSGMKTLVIYKTPMCSVKITTVQRLFSEHTPKWKQTSDYECTH